MATTPDGRKKVEIALRNFTPIAVYRDGERIYIAEAPEIPIAAVTRGDPDVPKGSYEHWEEALQRQKRINGKVDNIKTLEK